MITGLSEFKNLDYYVFPDAAAEKQMKKAVDKVSAELGREYPLLLGGKEIMTSEKFVSIDPGKPDRVVGRFQKGSKEEVELAVQIAQEAFNMWRWVSPRDRAEILLRAAEIARKKRNELIAMASFEVGKNWGEADKEVCELIDMLELYPRHMFNYIREELPPTQNEINEYLYEPLGVGVAITPWNFPFGLPAAMFFAALVCGNTVIWKPASDGAACAYQVMEIFKEAGLPDGVLNILTGSGETVGDGLVTHPRIRFICFTGSTQVGLKIYEKAAVVQPGQKWLKRTMAELGGKNAIYVDSCADIDSAVEGIVYSAFAYQGQKCSAGSRLILHTEVYSEVVNKVIAKVKNNSVGPAHENYDINPVINKQSQERILSYIGTGKNEANLIIGGNTVDKTGFYIEPTIFENVDPNSSLAQEEIFGPVLAIMKVSNFNEALKIANGTDYGLTGSIYSKNPQNIAKAKKEWYCGNFYVNRSCTGAAAGIHPFGGFNLSGTNSKVGGPSYLTNYLQDKTIITRYR